MKLKITVFSNWYEIGRSWYFEGSKVNKKNLCTFFSNRRKLIDNMKRIGNIYTTPIFNKFIF